MISSKTFDDLARHLADLAPPGMREVREDIERNFRAVLQSAFAKLDLVTREEFEVQQAVLARTREKVQALEETVARLEEQIPGTGEE